MVRRRYLLDREGGLINLMRPILVSLSLVILAACAAIPVQETTLRNANGGTVTCKQVGRGIVSYGVGKSLGSAATGGLPAISYFGT